MAGIRFRHLCNTFIETLERSGATIIRENQNLDDRPVRFRVINNGRNTNVILFLWTITTGGGGVGIRPANERRIQITGVEGMPLLPGIRTLLGGWHQATETYAFWDARRHTLFSQRSPSLQVNLQTLEQGSQSGIASQVRPNKRDNQRMGEETVIACNPSSLLWYVEHGGALHNAESDAGSIVRLTDVEPEVERDFIDSSENEIVAARRYDLVETMRAYRDSKFRPAVLHAYSYRCCVCDCDLNLVDAAHIVPVSDPRSSDEVTNGLALCRLHHGAYDNGLLGVQSNLQIAVNPFMLDRLHDIKLDTGIETFRSKLPEKIRIPKSVEVRPAPKNLLLGLKSRHWPEAYIR